MFFSFSATVYADVLTDNVVRTSGVTGCYLLYRRYVCAVLKSPEMNSIISELHQLVSPKTAYEFLDSLLDTSTKVKNSLDEAGLFATYVAKSWAGILKSRGVF